MNQVATISSSRNEPLAVLRFVRFLLLLVAAWVVMTFTHELGHLLGGWWCGGTLTKADLLPWHLPYSLFEPDPYPLVTLWSGLIFGVVFPLALAMVLQRDEMWFIAHFCILANGAYIATGWVTGDSYLDTAQLLKHGSSPITMGLYCAVTIGFGYVGFRRSCIRTFVSPQPAKAVVESAT